MKKIHKKKIKFQYKEERIVEVVLPERSNAKH